MGWHKSEPVITMKNTTHDDVKAALGIVTAVADAIRELGEVPSGHLYANLMSKLSLEQYEQVIGVLKSTGLITESNAHLLTWVSPAARPDGPIYVCAVDRGGCGRTFPSEDGFRNHDCTDISSPAMSMLEVRTKPLTCPDCGKPTNKDGACETCAASTCCECGKPITPAADLSLGVCEECTEKSEHEEEGRR
jgi:hypothetical protein